MEQHEKYMRRAIELAKKGLGFTNPNPLVGAVIVKDNRIIGEGYHEKYGDLHAERNAFLNCVENPEGSVMYVTLEPCAHHGKQPPCMEAIVEHNIKEVYIGSRDPNPLVSGKGAFYLRQNGIIVHEDFLREECDKLNPIFFHYITSKLPFVIAKYAMSIDGKIACENGASQWITNEQSRNNVHQTRKQVSAILVGIQTVLKDNPMLNCRCEHPSHPVRVVLDSALRIPMDSRLVQTAKQIPLLVYTATENTDKINELSTAGVTVIPSPFNQNGIDLDFLLQDLGNRKIDSLLVEGGTGVLTSFIKENKVDLLQVYIGNKILGGKSFSPVGSLEIQHPDESALWNRVSTQTFADDILLEYRKES